MPTFAHKPRTRPGSRPRAAALSLTAAILAVAVAVILALALDGSERDQTGATPGPAPVARYGGGSAQGKADDGGPRVTPGAVPQRDPANARYLRAKYGIN